MYITKRQAEQAERVAQKLETRAEWYYSGDGIPGYCMTEEQAETAALVSEQIYAAISRLRTRSGTTEDVMIIRTALSGKPVLDEFKAVSVC